MNFNRDEYGNEESNPFNEDVQRIRDAIREQDTIDLTDKRLRAIVRLRLVTSPGFPFYDLSYCYGQLKDGTYVRFRLPRYQFSRRQIKGEFIEMCKAAGVHGKKLGLLDDDVISILR